MSMIDSEEHRRLLQSLQSMSRSQLEQVRQRASYHLQHKTGAIESVEDEDWLMLGILHELDRRGLDARPIRLKKPASFAQYQTQSENVRALLLKAAPGLNVLQRRALGQVASKELARYLTWVDVNRGSMLMYVSKIPEAIDAAYPGYMAAKMLGLVVGAGV